MIDLTLNSFLHPDLVGLKPPFGTIIERTVENKGGLSTAQTDNNMAMPFALMRPVTVATNDTTSKVEYDAKLLLTGDTPLTIHLDDAVYEGCTVTIVNGCTPPLVVVPPEEEEQPPEEGDVAVAETAEVTDAQAEVEEPLSEGDSEPPEPSTDATIAAVGRLNGWDNGQVIVRSYEVLSLTFVNGGWYAESCESAKMKAWKKEISAPKVWGAVWN